MKQKFTQTTSTRLSVLTLHWIWRAALFSVMLGVMVNHQLTQMNGEEPPKVFYFSAVQDNFYENPANWAPSYPGTMIDMDQKIVLQDMAYVTGYDLQIKGELEIVMGATLFASAGKLEILPEGQLSNHGELIMDQVENQGQVSNYMGAKIHVKRFVSSEDASVDNLKSASFIVIEKLTNQGNFSNYSLCTTGEFINSSDFQQRTGGELRVDGKMVPMAANFTTER